MYIMKKTLDLPSLKLPFEKKMLKKDRVLSKKDISKRNSILCRF